MQRTITSGSASGGQGTADRRFGEMTLQFEANQGQTDARAKFLAHGHGYSLFLTSSEAIFSVSKPLNSPRKDKRERSAPSKVKRREIKPASGEQKIVAAKGSPAILRMKLVAANAGAEIAGMEELPGKVNYLIGNDPRRWQTGIATYAKVRYREVYQGIDLVYYGNRQQLEYDFVVGAGGDPGAIRWAFTGAQKMSVDSHGDLLLQVSGVQLRQRKPVVYQDVNGERRQIPGRYVMRDSNQVGFQVAVYDRSRPLIIDPVLEYSTYLGGTSSDDGYGVAVDSYGNAYLTGETDSFDFPTANPLQAALGADVFVAKLNAAGSALVYSTYLGGDGYDLGRSIAVDSDGEAIITGDTSSSNFPLMSPFQTQRGGNSDAFVAKLNAAGSALVYSTYLGGADFEFGKGIASDSEGNGYVTGDAHSFNFPTLNPYQAAKRGNQSPLYDSTNGGNNWSASNAGMTAAAVWALAADPANPSMIYAATSNGVYKSSDGGSNWNAASHGLPGVDVLALAISPASPSTLYVYCNQYGLFKSTDGGDDWTALAFPSSSNTTVTAIYPASADTVYAGNNGDGIFKSTDGGQSWLSINTGLSELGVNALAVNPQNPSILYAGTWAGVFKSTDGGGSWVNVSTGQMTPDFDASVFALNFDPTNPSTIYAGTSGGGMYKTTDAGSTWKGINNNLPTDQVTAVAVNSTSPSTLYAGVQILINSSYWVGGLYRSTDGGNSWSDAGSGLNQPYVTALVANSTSVVTGIYTGPDAFVTKLGPTGSLVYSTYLGGSDIDRSHAIAVDSSGHAYVTGDLFSLDFPTVNAVQPNGAVSDAFVTKLSQNGSALDYSTYLGGPYGNEYGNGIAVDANGNAYITGSTTSTDFPVTPGAYQPHGNGDVDGFVTKLSPSGSSFVYSTYLGGGLDDEGNAIAVDSAGNAYVTGYTMSDDFPTLNAVQPALGNEATGYTSDAFVTKLNPSGTAPLYSTYLGGESYDWGYGIALNSSGNAYITGTTRSDLFPTVNPLQNGGVSGWSDAFVAKITDTPGYSISGFLGFSDGRAVAGQTVHLGGAQDRTVLTDDFGRYMFTSLPAGDYIIKPSGGYTFTPASRPITNLNHDLTGLDFTVAPVSISGQVKSGADGTGGVTMTLNGNYGFVRKTTTLSDGSYSFQNLPANYDYELTASKSGYTFTPAQRSYTSLLTNQSLQNFSAIPNRSIGGQVKVGTTGLGGVTMTLTSGPDFAPRTVVTSSVGSYSFGNLPAGRTYIVRAAKTNYSFTPASRTFSNLSADQAGADFAASLKTFNIWGRINVAGGTAGVGAVSVTIKSSTAGFTPRTVTTSSTGSFSFTNLPAGRTYIVTPTQINYTFTPVSRTYTSLSANQTTANFAATLKTYSISGKVAKSGTTTGISGVTMTLTSPTPAGFAARSVQTTSTGAYTFTNLPAGRSYTIKPTKTGLTFTPTTRSFANLSGSVTAGPSSNFTGTGP